LLPCCRFHPAEVKMPRRSAFGTPCCLRPPEVGSALGSRLFEATFAFTVVTARQLLDSPRATLSIAFRILFSPPPGGRHVSPRRNLPVPRRVKPSLAFAPVETSLLLSSIAVCRPCLADTAS